MTFAWHFLVVLVAIVGWLMVGGAVVAAGAVYGRKKRAAKEKASMPGKVTLEFCPICGAQLRGRHGGGTSRQGLEINIGHSDGGWGQRRDDLIFSDEVCWECDEALRAPVLALWQKIVDSRRGKNKTFVVVTDTNKTKVQ